MKTSLLGKIGIGYFVVGAILGLISEGSYIYGALRASFGCGDLWEKIVFVWVGSLIGMISSFVQFVLWLPNLIFWAVKQDVGFSYWLAPGLETSCG